MKIAVLVYANQDVGLGHWNRSRALIDELERRGHYVWTLGNMMTHRKMYYQVREGSRIDLYHVIEQLKPDVLIADLQGEIPEYIYELVDPERLVVLNGVGRETETRAGMVFIQGLVDVNENKNVFSGIDYIILRPELQQWIAGPEKEWFVFGGAKDKMHLSPAFQEVFPETSANILMTNMSVSLNNTYRTMYHDIFIPSSPDKQIDTFRQAVAGVEKACLAMGMTAWETVALGIPTYVFSSTSGHLSFAKKMEDAGILRAYDGVGIPHHTTLVKEFLDQKPMQSKLRPDFMGASRVADKLEERYG